MKTVLLSIIITAVCFVLLAVKVIFVRGGRFPSGHVGHSPAMRRKGITCASHDTVGMTPEAGHKS